MRSAPAVSVVCHDGGVWRAATGLLHGLAIAAVLAWGLGWIEVTWSPFTVVAIVLAALAGAWWSTRRPAAPSSLAWDGQAWRVDEAAVARVVVMIDLGGWMLLAIDREDGSRRWCALSAAATGPAWRALRSAVFAQAQAAPRTSP